MTEIFSFDFGLTGTFHRAVTPKINETSVRSELEFSSSSTKSGFEVPIVVITEILGSHKAGTDNFDIIGIYVRRSHSIISKICIDSKRNFGLTGFSILDQQEFTIN